MAARERYVDLSPCYDLAAAKALAPELTACADAYRAAYAGAYHVLRALGGIESERRVLVRAALDEERLLRRASGIAARELKGRGSGSGRTTRAFLGALTARGAVEHYETARALCPRVYELCDGFGLAASALRLLHRAALEAGEDVLLCPDPLLPTQPRHLLIPSRGVAFLTTEPTTRLAEKPYRRLRIDSMAEGSLDRAQKARLRLLRRLRRELEEEAVSALTRAKSGHDALEALYRPCVDFAAVDALCERELARLCAYAG